jgi:hypothetical protein
VADGEDSTAVETTVLSRLKAAGFRLNVHAA